VRGVLDNPEPRSCTICKRTFLPVRRGQKYCGAKCRLSNAAKAARSASVRRDSYTCTQCGRPFAPRRKDQLTCGATCPGPERPSQRRVECGSAFTPQPRGREQIYCQKRCRDRASRRRLSERFRRYKLERLEYDFMVLDQGNQCAICGEEPKNYDRYGLVVDHDHATGEVRGLLCNRCNMGIGLFDDDQAKLSNAARYVARPA
jgi:hypothetical protein